MFLLTVSANFGEVRLGVGAIALAKAGVQRSESGGTNPLR
jgi:hypothetical protein